MAQLRPLLAISIAASFGLTSVATLSPAHAKGHRYAHEVPGTAAMAVDTYKYNRGIQRNRRRYKEDDFAGGKGRTFGGTVKAYVGNNDVFAGDFNGDGHDDIGVRWKSGSNANRWTISFNDKRGNFEAGKGVSFGGTVEAYAGNNRLFVGDFNKDGFDDIGVHWKSGPNTGRWTVSLNDKKGNFKAGKGVSFGGTVKAYLGSNEPVVGDFNGDGFDDIGVRWLGGAHKGKWTISFNDKKGNFKAGKGVFFGGVAKAYVGSNQVLVGDFNGDGRDDIGVRWTGGSAKYRWTISLNDGAGNFEPGRKVTFAGNLEKAYKGSATPIVGDFHKDGFDDIGVKWTGGANNGRWVFSRNQRRQRITRTRALEVRMPVVFVNGLSHTTTAAQAEKLLDNVRRFFGRSTHGLIDFKFKYRIVKLAPNPQWHAGVPDPIYGTDGKLENGADFPKVEDYDGYGCRFPFPGKPDEPQIVFKDTNKSLEWSNNGNIHRNYCQVAERNFAKDALKRWAAADAKHFDDTMKWAASGSGTPMFAMMTPGMSGGGNRTLNKSVDNPWPLKIRGFTFRDYIYLDQRASTLAHELGHAIGHDGELYAAKKGNQCEGRDGNGYLGKFALMGSQYALFPALNGVNRWRFGFAEARYVTPDEGSVELSIPIALEPSATGRTVAVVHPDPAGHPDEVWVIEYRAKVKSKSFTYDRLNTKTMFVYHVNAKNPTVAQPRTDLVNVQQRCPGELEPFNGTLTDTHPDMRFHDGKSARFEITNVRKLSKELKVRVTFK